MRSLLPVVLALVHAAPAPDLAEVLNNLQDGIQLSDIQAGIAPDFMNWNWTSQQVLDQLGIDPNAWNQIPTQFMNIPGYGNYTANGWAVRIHGQAFKEPLGVSQTVLDEAANVFLPDLDISQLTPSEQDNARNLTSAILSIPQEGLTLEFTLRVSSGQKFTSSWSTDVTWPRVTDPRGELDGFVVLSPTADLPDGTNNAGIVRLDVHSKDYPNGNTTAYLVPTEGVTIVSDIDDILRVTKIYNPQEGLLNTFARDFVPWMNMPQRFDEWSKQHPEQPYHFHYLTTTPEQATRVYEEFIYATYPFGSFDTRPLNFTTFDQIFNVRRTLLMKILQTFPSRRFVLVGDTTNSDVLSDYPSMMRAFPNNVQCILIRNTSATEPANLFPYDTSSFEGLDANKWMFFRTPDDLAGLDFANGDCVNPTVPQNVSFGYQGFDLGGVFSAARHAREKAGWWSVGVAFGIAVGLAVM